MSLTINQSGALLTLFEKWPAGQFAASDFRSVEIAAGSPLETKSPASQAGLEQLPVGTLLAKQNHYNTVRQASRLLLKSSGRAEDDGVEP